MTIFTKEKKGSYEVYSDAYDKKWGMYSCGVLTFKVSVSKKLARSLEMAERIARISAYEGRDSMELYQLLDGEGIPFATTKKDEKVKGIKIFWKQKYS